MLLHLGMRPVQRVPGAAAPALESDLIGGEGLAVRTLDEPVGVLLEDVPTSSAMNGATQMAGSKPCLRMS